MSPSIGLPAVNFFMADVGGGLGPFLSTWLAQTQRPDGTWDEPWFTGTGFPGDFYINYHLYRLAFPVSALGRYVSAASGGPPPQAPPTGGHE